jgi:23S rRNA (uracil-5-)-methyltransferase RumA
LKKGALYTGIVESVEFPNKGIVMVPGEDERVIVKNVIPGQRVELRVTKHRSNHYEGNLVRVIDRSACENVTACRDFGVCGGCVYQTMDYESQLAMKEGQVKRLMDGVIRRPYEFEGILGSPSHTGYRNKMEYTFGDEYKDGPLALGLHKRQSMYDIVTCDGCQLVHPDFERILHCVLEYCSQAGLSHYHRLRHDGYLRHLLVRRAARTGEILVDIVTTTECSHDFTELAKKLCGLSLDGRLVVFLHTYNDSQADAIKNDRTELVYGQDYFYEEILGLRFKITPFSFFQTNSLGAEVLYSKAREYVGETRDKLVFDLYSGTGTIAQLMAPVAKKVIGVELVGEAVEAARVNAASNGLGNCEFIAGDVLKVIDDIQEKPDLIILDPPRDGIHPKALLKILSYEVDRIVYISCKASSLARDLEVIQDYGYGVEKVACVDMFPMTSSVETVCLLSKKNSNKKDYVEIGVDAEDYHKIKEDKKN